MAHTALKWADLMRSHYSFGRWELGVDLRMWCVGFVMHPDTFAVIVGPFFISREAVPF
jgi:hypothetical protein